MRILHCFFHIRIRRSINAAGLVQELSGIPHWIPEENLNLWYLPKQIIHTCKLYSWSDLMYNLLSQNNPHNWHLETYKAYKVYSTAFKSAGSNGRQTLSIRHAQWSNSYITSHLTDMTTKAEIALHVPHTKDMHTKGMLAIKRQFSLRSIHSPF